MVETACGALTMAATLEILKQLSADQILFLVAAVFIVLSFINPKRFFGIEVDWDYAKSPCLFIGLALLAVALVRLWAIDAAVIEALARPLTESANKPTVAPMIR